jgi:hypothetical protein
MASKKVTTKLFAAISPDFGPRFAFNARTGDEAARLIDGYNRYHSFNNYPETAYTVEEIQVSDLPGLKIAIRNEYVN